MSFLTSAEGAGQPVKLRANLQTPLANPFYGVSLARFKEEVERRSGNAISIEIIDNARLYRDDQVVDAVSSGAVDIGVTSAQQFSNRAPAVGILDQPFLFNFPALMRAAAAPGSEIRKVLDEAVLADVGARVLWWQSLGDNVVFSRGRDVADPERIRNQTVAAPGNRPGEFIAWCGGKPAVLSVETFYEAFKDGKIDMAMITLGALESRGLWKVTDTVTMTAHAPVEFFLVINERTWQSLAPEHRAIIAEVASSVERETRNRTAEFDARANAFAASKGIKTRQLTPDEVAEWRACSAGMLAEFMDKNVERARRLMAAYGRLRTDPCCSAGPSELAFTRR